MRLIATVLALAVLASCGRGALDESASDVRGEEGPIKYRSAFGVERLEFDRSLSRVQGIAAGGEAISLLDCSNEEVVCRELPGGPVFIAVARDIERTDAWAAGDRSFVVRARDRVDTSEVVFVEVRTATDLTWKEAFTYRIGVGVTSITVNYDEESRLSETLLLVGDEGAMSSLN